MFSTIYGKDTIDKLGIQEIEPNNVSLSQNILNKLTNRKAQAPSFFIYSKQKLHLHFHLSNLKCNTSNLN